MTKNLPFLLLTFSLRMPRKRQAEKIKLIIKGEPSPAALPVEIGLSLPCMAEIRKRLGGSVLVVEGKPIWTQNSAANDFKEG